MRAEAKKVWFQTAKRKVIEKEWSQTAGSNKSWYVQQPQERNERMRHIQHPRREWETNKKGNA